MKTIASTPTFHNKTSNSYRGFITPPQHCQGGYPASVGGFYFGIFALLMGAIQSKEVAVAKEGINLYCSNIVFQSSLRKVFSL